MRTSTYNHYIYSLHFTRSQIQFGHAAFTKPTDVGRIALHFLVRLALAQLKAREVSATGVHWGGGGGWGGGNSGGRVRGDCGAGEVRMRADAGRCVCVCGGGGSTSKNRPSHHTNKSPKQFL